MLPPCAIVAEASHLDVGRGVALVDLDVRLVREQAACRLDLGAVLLAREEGRGPPELIVWRAEIDGGAMRASGPRGEVALDVPARAMHVRIRAALRGERFVAAPLSTDRSARTETGTFTASATSTWGARTTAGVAQWVDLGTPIVVRVDAARDHEPMTILVRLGLGDPEAMIVDGGPILGAAPTATTPEERRAELAKGGARALSILLTDLPLAIATAPDDVSVIARLREASLSALAASSAKDPMLAAVGQRLTTAIATGFRSCARDASLSMPAHWPPLLPALADTGVLEDESAGCPRVAELIATNHPEIPITRESMAALDEAIDEGANDLPTIGPLFRRTSPLATTHAWHAWKARHRTRLLLVGAVALVLSVAIWIAWMSWKSRLKSTRSKS